MSYVMTLQKYFFCLMHGTYRLGDICVRCYLEPFFGEISYEIPHKMKYEFVSEARMNPVP